MSKSSTKCLACGGQLVATRVYEARCTGSGETFSPEYRMAFVCGCGVKITVSGLTSLLGDLVEEVKGNEQRAEREKGG